MVTVVIGPGESVRVELSEADGSFEVRFGEDALTVVADLPGSGRPDASRGEIYREDWTPFRGKEVASGDDPDCVLGVACGPR